MTPVPWFNIAVMVGIMTFSTIVAHTTSWAVRRWERREFRKLLDVKQGAGGKESK